MNTLPSAPVQSSTQLDAEIVPLFSELPANPGRNPAERINFWHDTFRRHMAITLAAGLRAGHELAMVRESIGNRGFANWVEKNLTFTTRHAYRYLSAFEQTIAKERASLPQPIPLSAPLTEEEVRATAAEFGATTFRGLQKALQGPGNWGGKREGAGRPPARAAATAEEARANVLHVIGVALQDLAQPLAQGGGAELLEWSELKRLKDELADALDRVSILMAAKTSGAAR